MLPRMPAALRTLGCFCLSLASTLLPLTAAAQVSSSEATPPISIPGVDSDDELRLIRRLLEVQSKQIEALTQEIAELRAQLDRMVPRAVAAHPPQTTQDTPPFPAQTPADRTSLPPAPDMPIREGPTHSVIAGETLTVIARLHNTTVAKLKELNNIVDERKLQIGQLLLLPETHLEQQTPAPQETP